MRRNGRDRSEAFELTAAAIVASKGDTDVIYRRRRALTRRQRRALEAVAAIVVADTTLDVRDARAEEFATLLASHSPRLHAVRDDSADTSCPAESLSFLRRRVVRATIVAVAVLMVGAGSVAMASFRATQRDASPRQIERARLALVEAHVARAQAHLDQAERLLDQMQVQVRSGVTGPAIWLAAQVRNEISAAVDIVSVLPHTSAAPLLDRASDLSRRLAQLVGVLRTTTQGSTTVTHSPTGDGSDAEHTDGGVEELHSGDGNRDPLGSGVDSPEPTSSETPGSEPQSGSDAGVLGSD